MWLFRDSLSYTVRGGGDGEFPAKDKWNSNSLKCKLSSETTSPQIYCYCYFFFFFYKLLGSLESQLTRSSLISLVFCSFFLPQTDTRMAAKALITKPQIKFLFLDFLLFSGQEWVSRGSTVHTCKWYFHLILTSMKYGLNVMIRNTCRQEGPRSQA